MEILPLIFILGFTSGADVHTGFGFHAMGADEPEIFMPNPTGIVRLEWKLSDRLTARVSHVSSLPYWEEGKGLNMAELTWRLGE